MNVQIFFREQQKVGPKRVQGGGSVDRSHGLVGKEKGWVWLRRALYAKPSTFNFIQKTE